MQGYAQHYKDIKDSLFDICRSIAGNISSSELSRLLKGSLVPQASVRTSVLQAIREYIDLTELDFSEEIWLAVHDDVNDNIELARAIWQENALEALPTDAAKVLPYLASKDSQLRRASSKALAACIGDGASEFLETLHDLEKQYVEQAKPRQPERDEFGMPKKTSLEDPWEVRSGIASAFKALASKFPAQELVAFAEFLITSRALADRNPTVRDQMIESATTVFNIKGSHAVEPLMNVFEATLDEGDEDSQVSDSLN